MKHYDTFAAVISVSGLVMAFIEVIFALLQRPIGEYKIFSIVERAILSPR